MKRIAPWLLRLASMAVGAAILYHEVYVAETSEWPLLLLGVWFLGVSPATWLDALRRTGQLKGSPLDLLENTESKHESKPDPRER